MIPLVAAALLAAAPLPEGAARYRVELAGVHVGVAELELACRGSKEAPCTVRWATQLRLPGAAGGEVRTRRFETAFDPADEAAALPASAAEVTLGAALAAGERRCRAAVDEESGRRGQACARRLGEELEVEVLGVVERVTLSPDGLPARVALPAQRMRFLRDPAAALPSSAPALEVRVAGPAAPPRAFCGLPPDPPPPAADLSQLPTVAPTGAPCQAQAAAYAEAAARAGLPSRLALGVAHDGGGYVWHAWTEVRTAAGWIPVDPAFGQRPARGPRFTVARLPADDAAARQVAGERILACWGRAAE